MLELTQQDKGVVVSLDFRFAVIFFFLALLVILGFQKESGDFCSVFY